MKKEISQAPSEHSYPNSTIIEALCELHFTSEGNASDETWDGKWFGRLLTELSLKYDMEPKLVGGVQISAGQTIAIGHMIYRCKDNSHLIQLSPWKLTINELKYESWNTFFQHIQYACKCLSKIINSIEIKRIGMRYINKIPRTSKEESVGSWISDTGLVPRKILEQTKNFFYRSESEKSDNMKLILTISEETSTLPSSLIFDIDIVSIKKVNSDWDSISLEINNIHNEIRGVFDTSRTEKYTNFLKKIS